MSIIICPECGKQISTRAKYCIQCGLPLSDVIICPECGTTEFKETVEKCGKCGFLFFEEAFVDTERIKTTNKSRNRLKNEQQYVETAEELISKVLAHHNFSDVGFVYNAGLPIVDKEKASIIRQAFNIPEQDKVYFAVSANILSTINKKSKGFAVASHGIYFRANGREKGMFYLHQLTEVKIDKLLGFLRIGAFEFNLGNNGRRVMNMLLELQQLLRETL